MGRGHVVHAVGLEVVAQGPRAQVDHPHEVAARILACALVPDLVLAEQGRAQRVFVVVGDRRGRDARSDQSGCAQQRKAHFA